MKRIIALRTAILGLGLLCSSVVLGQDRHPGPLPGADFDQSRQTFAVPEQEKEYDPVVGDIINQTNLDSLIAYVRILSGEDSTWINGLKVRIQHRISDLGNDLAADYIKSQLERYDNLEVYDQTYDEEGRNIYAIQQGMLYPEKQFILCAHYDAVPDYAADDNASGVAAVLEAARTLSRYNLEYTLVYALWDEEELGLKGSSYYASRAKVNNTDILGVINMDMIGWDSDDDRLADIHSSDVSSSNILANLLVTNNSLYELNLNPVIYNPGTGASDHASFWNNDYGAILLIEAYYGNDFNSYYHSDEDRIARFNLPYFHSMSKLAIGSISSLVGFVEDTVTKANPAKETSRFSVYPNPANDLLYISTGSQELMSGCSIRIINQQGSVIYQSHIEGPLYEINLSSWGGTGLYYIMILDTGGSILDRRKIILR